MIQQLVNRQNLTSRAHCWGKWMENSKRNLWEKECKN